jgi:peptidoglycan hydrolase CwlO-like protein
MGRTPRLVLAAATLAVIVAMPASASGDLSSQLDHKRAELRHTRSNEVALNSAIDRFSREIDGLSAEIADLRAREAIVHQELVTKAAELRRAKARLSVIRRHLRLALGVLKQHLVAVYESGQPDAMTVILSSRGFDQMISRYEYVHSIAQSNNAIAERVATLRDAAKATVAQLEAARNALAARRDELASTQATLESRQSSLTSAQAAKKDALVRVRDTGRKLQHDVLSLTSRLAAQQAAAEGLGTNSVGGLGTVFPAGTPASGDAISPFPAGEPLTWGRTDQGVDGGTRPGSPLLAMGSGTISIEHDPYGFGNSYPVLYTSFGDFYYGHCVPAVADGAHVQMGQQVAMAHYGTWGNSTTPGGFEIGAWPPGGMTAGGAIRTWLIALPRI